MGESHFIKTPEKKKRVHIPEEDMKRLCERFYLEMEDFKDLSKDTGVDSSSLRQRIGVYMRTDAGVEIKRKAKEMGHIAVDGRRKRVDPNHRILRYVENNPGCGTRAIAAVTGLSPGTVGFTISRRLGEEIYTHKDYSGTRYWIKGTEPDMTAASERKRPLGDTGYMKLFERYYLELVSIEELAEEAGVTVPTLRMRVTGLRHTKTASDILKKAEELGHLVADGGRIRENSDAFRAAMSIIEAERAELAEPEPLGSITLESFIDMLARRIAHYMKEDDGD